MSATSSQAPAVVQELITHYQNLRINGALICTPYFRNVKHERAGLRALLGKGTPGEIEQEVLIYAKLRGFELSEKSPAEIREFMLNQGIGVDCSGYITHLLFTWLKHEYHQNLFSVVAFRPATLIRRIIRWFRPVENLDADTLTNAANTFPVLLTDVQPGDLLRLKGIDSGHHVAMIIQVDRNEHGQVKQLTYTHSTDHYSDANGVHIGTITVTNPQTDLRTQRWHEVDRNNHCWTLEQLLKDYDDNGLRRPKFFTHSHA